MPDPPNSVSSDDSPSNSPNPRSLTGQTIVVTRAAEQADWLCKILHSMGARTIAHPVIRILPPESFLELDRVISQIDQFDWLVFVSTNSVRFFVERLLAMDGGREKLKGRKIAAIGKSTADQLKRLGDVEVDMVPPRSNSQSLGASLATAAANQKLLIARADRRTSTLTDILSESGIEYKELIAYRSCDVESVDPEVARRMAEREIDWVTITSGAIARSAIHVFGEELRKTKLVSISPETSAVLRERGFDPDAEAVTYDMNGIVEAIKQHVLRET
jgi:uroporphyrinogen-III synthase